MNLALLLVQAEKCYKRNYTINIETKSIGLQGTLKTIKGLEAAAAAAAIVNPQAKKDEGTDAFSQLLSSHGHNLKLQKTQDGDDAAVKKLKPVLNPSLSQNMFVN